MRVRAILALLVVTVPVMAAPKDVGLKMTVRDTFSGLTSERTTYTEVDRRRFEYRSSSGNSYGPPLASVTRCDLGQIFELNLKDRQYDSGPLPRLPSEEEMKARAANSVRAGPPRPPTILIEITTVDTGERKKIFGYEARHVITTRKQTPLDGGQDSASVDTTDGWYTDLDARLSCEPRPRPGVAYAVLVTVRHMNGTPDEMPVVPKFKVIGKQESGFALSTTTTTHSTLILPAGSTKDTTSTSEMQVTDLYSGPLDPQLFEIPRGFRKVDAIRRNPDVPLSILVQEYWNELKLRVARVFH